MVSPRFSVTLILAILGGAHGRHGGIVRSEQGVPLPIKTRVLASPSKPPPPPPHHPKMAPTGDNGTSGSGSSSSSNGSESGSTSSSSGSGSGSGSGSSTASAGIPGSNPSSDAITHRGKKSGLGLLTVAAVVAVGGALVAAAFRKKQNQITVVTEEEPMRWHMLRGIIPRRIDQALAQQRLEEQSAYAQTNPDGSVGV